MKHPLAAERQPGSYPLFATAGSGGAANPGVGATGPVATPPAFAGDPAATPTRTDPPAGLHGAAPTGSTCGSEPLRKDP